MKGVGAKKFSMSFEIQGNQIFWWDLPGLLPGFPGVPKNFEKKKVGVRFSSPI